MQENQELISTIETGELLFKEIGTKAQVSKSTVIKIIYRYYLNNGLKQKFDNCAASNIRISSKNNHTVLFGDNINCHFYAQYNSGSSQVPWYRITKNVKNRLDAGEIKGIFLVYVRYNGGIVNATIQSCYCQYINADNIDWGEHISDAGYELTYKFSEKENIFSLDKEKDVKMVSVKEK